MLGLLYAGRMDGTLAAAKAAPGWAAEMRATIALAWALVLTNLSQVALTVTDALFLCHVGTEALAAATLGGNLFFAALAPAFGMALAAAPMAAQTRGRGRGHLRGMRRDVRAAFWAAAAATLPAWLLLWHCEAVLLALGQEPALASLASDHVRALMWAIPLFCGFVVLRGFLAAEQRPGAALAVAFAGVVVHVPLNFWLIHGGLGVPALGVVGAGLATSLSDAAMLAGLAALILRDRRLRRYRLFGRLWRFDPARLRDVARIGLPIAGATALEIAVFATAAIAMGWLGALAVAAHAIAVQVASMTFMVPMGLAQAATTRVGLMTGAGRPAAASRAGWVAIAPGLGCRAAMAVALLAAARPIAWLFLEPGNAEAGETAALAVTLVTVAGLFQLADGAQSVAAGALRGLKDTRVPMLLGGFGYCVIGRPCGLVLALPLGLGPLGIRLGLAIGLFLVAGLMLARWTRLAAAGGLTLRRRLR
jgi:MATE family multidrug resistance protein